MANSDLLPYNTTLSHSIECTLLVLGSQGYLWLGAKPLFPYCYIDGDGKMVYDLGFEPGLKGILLRDYEVKAILTGIGRQIRDIPVDGKYQLMNTTIHISRNEMPMNAQGVKPQLIGIRNWWVSNEVWRPTKDGITVPLDQWDGFMKDLANMYSTLFEKRVKICALHRQHALEQANLGSGELDPLLNENELFSFSRP